MQLRHWQNSLTLYEHTIEVTSNNYVIHCYYGDVLCLQGRLDEGVTHFTEALRLSPDWATPMNNLAWFLATNKAAEFYDLEKATRFAERACELTDYENYDMLDTLAVAYAAAGRFSRAIKISEKAIKLANSAGKKDLAEIIQGHMQLYKSGQCYYEQPAAEIITEDVTSKGIIKGQ